MAGRGTTRIKYDAEIEQYEKETGEKEENVSYQTVCGEDIVTGKQIGRAHV